MLSAVLLGRLTSTPSASSVTREGSELMQRVPRRSPRVPGAATLVALIVAQTFVRGCLNVLIVVAAFDVLDGSGADVGFLTAAIGLGGLVGAVGAHGAAPRLSRAFASSLVFWGLPIIALAPPATSRSRCCCWRSSAQRTASRTSPASRCCSGCAEPRPRACVRRRLGARDGRCRARLAVAAVAVGLVGATARSCSPGRAADARARRYRRLRSIEASVPPAARLDVLEGVPIFAPLSLAAKEQVAAQLSEAAAEPGQRVMRAGTPATSSTSCATAS